MLDTADVLPSELGQWLAAQADSLDSSPALSGGLLTCLADHSLFRPGVSAGTSGHDLGRALMISARLAAHSMAAALMYWAQQMAIECVKGSTNPILQDALLTNLIDGTFAGAPALSNAIATLDGSAAFQVHGRPTPAGLAVEGRIAWVSNLVPDKFILIAPVRRSDGGQLAIYAFPPRLPGITRGLDLRLFGLRASSTSSVRLTWTVLGPEWCLCQDGRTFLDRYRPLMMLVQSGLGLGLAHASLRQVEQLGHPQLVASPEAAEIRHGVDACWLLAHDLIAAIGHTRVSKEALITLRLRMIELATAAVMLELRTRGSSAYISGRDDGFQRRWRELALLPLLAPTQTQLVTELQRLRARGD